MKILLATLLCSLLFATPIGAEETIEMDIRVSETHGLLYMLESLMNQPHRSPLMAEVLRGRVGNWSPTARSLERWKESLNSDELSTMTFPRVQDKSVSIDAVLEKTALQAESADDLQHRVTPWLGPEHSRKFAKALLTLEPLYRSYYWGEAAPLLIKRKDELVGQLKKGDFENNFARAARFFTAQLPPEERPTLALVPLIPPIGAGRVNTHGHNSGSLQVMEVRVDRPLTDEAGVVFHEFAHALWWGQNKEERERWKNSFERHGLVGRLAYAQLNEGLATALGNGWFQEQVAGSLDEGDWYADPVIDTYGKALLGVVREPLESGRPPTEQELDRMATVFGEALPDAVNTFDVVASDFLTVSTLPEVHRADFQDELMRLGPVRWSRVREWEAEKPVLATFRLYWLEPGQRDKLREVGWPESQAQGWEQYSLRRTDTGWELAFAGTSEKLFALLREFQEKGLSQSDN